MSLHLITCMMTKLNNNKSTIQLLDYLYVLLCKGTMPQSSHMGRQALAKHTQCKDLNIIYMIKIVGLFHVPLKISLNTSKAVKMKKQNLWSEPATYKYIIKLLVIC